MQASNAKSCSARNPSRAKLVSARLPFFLAAAAALLAPGLRAAPSPLGWPDPTAQMRPWTRWWWMGSAVDAADLDRELARYHAAGLGGVEITPIYGVKGWEDRAIPYLTPRWMEMLGHAIKTGTSLGMETDMTTGTGWCFGGPTVSGSDANARLVVATQEVRQGASLTGTFDPSGMQALMAFSADGKSVDLTGGGNRTAEGGTWTVYAVSQKPSGVTVKRAAPGGAGPMLNPFFPDAMTRYLQWFEKPFAASPPSLRAFFQDSYEYGSNWAPDFFAQFEKFRGYRLQGELPALLGSGPDDRVARVKSDYRETISDIMINESMPTWVAWAHAHGALARYQAHGAPANLLDLYAVADIPETEMFHLERNVLVSKFASSAAHVSGRNLASAETGTWLAEHFTETLAGMKGLADALFLAGITHLIYHGTAYSPDEAPWPGWCFYASTEMNPRNSIWRDVPALNAYVTRCQSILQAGDSGNDVLLYWPIHDRWNDPQGMEKGFDIGGKWFDSEPVGTTAHRLWDRGYAFDYVSDRQLQEIKPGGRYRAVVVAPCELMPVETLQRLLFLKAGGLAVIFDTQLPVDVPGWHDLEARRKRFNTLLTAGKSTLFAGDLEKGLDAAGIRRETMVDHPGIHFTRRSYPGGLHYFIANRGEQPLDGWVSLSTNARSVEIMDAMSGRTGLAQTRPAGAGHTEIYLQLEPGESILLRTFETVETASLWPLHTRAAPIPLSGTWSVKFIDGGPALPAPFQTAALGSWTARADAQNFAGTALYALTFDAPPGRWDINLGEVCQSARVRLNGKPLGTVILPPFRVEAGGLRPKGNLLEVEVTNVSANRIRDMDIRHVPWKIFQRPNVLSVEYGPFDASAWPLTASGLLGPVTLEPQIPLLLPGASAR